MKRKTQSIGTPAKRRPSSDVKDTPHTPGTGKGRKRPQKLEISAYSPSVEATRLLSCGEGPQLGHPGRAVTRKPRAVETFPPDTKFIQAVAGGVHSLVLTSDGIIYSCGANEKGTVPVKGLEREAITNKFTEIEFSPAIAKLGKPVQIAAGASFSAALTAKGSVIAWGNLRDSQGDVSVGETLAKMQKEPVVVIRHNSKVIVKIAAGENHLVMLSEEGEVLTFGEGSVGQLGRSVRTEHIRSSYMADDSGRSLLLKVLEKSRFVRFVDVFACGFWTIAKSSDGRLFACGLNNFCQLGACDSAKSPSRNGVSSPESDPKGVGQEHGSKVLLLTHTDAFPSTKNWTHFDGAQHIVCRNDDGEVWAIGKNTDNVLGLGTWTGNNDNEHWRYATLQNVIIPDDEKAAGVTASLGTSIVWTTTGKAYAFGYDTVGQLGLGITDDEDKIVATPQLITSKHLDDHTIVSVSLSDNESLFLAAPRNVARCDGRAVEDAPTADKNGDATTDVPTSGDDAPTSGENAEVPTSGEDVQNSDGKNAELPTIGEDAPALEEKDVGVPSSGDNAPIIVENSETPISGENAPTTDKDVPIASEKDAPVVGESMDLSS